MRKGLFESGRCDDCNHCANADAICPTTGGVNVPPTVPRIPDTPIINASMVLHRSGILSLYMCHRRTSRQRHKSHIHHQRLLDKAHPGPRLTMVIGSKEKSSINCRSDCGVTAISVAMSCSSERYPLL